MEESLTKRQLQAIETKTRIYNASVELFKSRPYDDIKIREIADAAGVSVGSFYQYFENRDMLFIQGYENFEKRLKTAIDTENCENPVDNINFIIKFYIETINSMGDSYRRIFLIGELKLQVDYQDGSQKRPFNKYLEEYILEATKLNYFEAPFKEVYLAYSTAVKGVIYEWAYSNGGFNLEKTTKQVISLIEKHYLVK